MRTAALVACLMLVAACTRDTAPDPGPPAPRPPVSISGDRLILDGQPWWPAGLNAYQLATDWSVNAGCGAQVDLDEFFGSLPPRSLTRVNAFQSFAVHQMVATTDFSALDAVFDAAARHGQLLIVVLAPQDSACDAGGYKERDWYIDGWRERLDGHTMSFEDWVRTAVDRWRASPAVAMWELMGEPEAGVCTAGDCSLEQRQCPADAGEVLRTWTDRVGALVREQDPGRPITVGTVGGDQCGSAEDDFAKLAASPYVDVVQYHDYDEGRFLDRRLRETEKPVLVAEMGIEAGTCRSTTERARAVDRTFADYRERGAAGALLWSYVPDPRPDECSFDIGPDDPVHSVLATHNTIG